MRHILIVLAICGALARSHAQTGALNFSDVARWGNSQGKITAFDLQSSVEGLVSRTALTLSFQDFGDIQSDSLEMNFAFSLPKGSVVDSLFLWIGEVKQPAALKSTWTAWQIYSGIVKRRWDPALLTASGNDNYQLRVFPFSHGQGRRVQICYSTPLLPFFDRLRMEIPFQLTLPSAQAVESIRAEVRFDGIAKDRIAISSPQSEAWEKAPNGDGTRLTFRTDGRTLKDPGYILIDHPDYARDGMAVHFEADRSGETHFLALLNPRKALGLPLAKKKRKLLVLWNLVNSSPNLVWAGSGYVSQGAMQYYQYGPTMTQEGKDLADFLQSNLSPGDEMNVMLNDLELKNFHEGFATVDEATFPALRGFLDGNMAQTYKYGVNGKTAAELLAEGLRSLKGSAGAELLIVDRYSQAYWWDTSFSDGVDAKSLVAAAPESLTAYVIAQTASTGGNVKPTNLSLAYQNLARSTGGTLINSGYQYYPIAPVLEGLRPFFSVRIYPAALGFSAGSAGFAYDIFGMPDMFYLDQNIVVMGKLSLPAALPEPGQPRQSMTVRFQGKTGGKDVSLEKQVSVTRTAASSNLPELWGAGKVASLLQSGYYSPRLWEEATDWSLRYRILTPVTALIALEPGRFDTTWYQDQQPSNIPGLPTRLGAGGQAKPIAFSLSIQPGFLVLDLPGQSARTSDFSLQVYDTRGRLTADLTSLAMKESGNLRWSTVALVKGVYVVKLRLKGKLVSKTFTVR